MERGEVEVHLLPIRHLLQQPVEPLLHYFGEARQKQILRYQFPADRNRTVWAELLARSVAARKLSCLPEQVAVERDAQGRPFLLGSSLHISISHSANWAAISIGACRSGVDVEGESRDGLEIARQFFLPREYQSLCSMAAEQQGESFLRMWTRKESYFKCTGNGDWLRKDSQAIEGVTIVLPDGAVASSCPGARFFMEPRHLSLEWCS